MRHLIGGFCLGGVVGLFTLGASKEKPLQVLITALLFSGIAWGLF